MLAEVHRDPTGTGPLDGTSVVVKELVAIGGHELTANSEVALPDRWAHPTDDAAIVAALRAAGAHIVGTGTTHEFAWGITTYDRGRTVNNPVLPGRIAGGSSGGSAEAVALGEADLGIGTDTAGSVRIPAAWCHLVGWKFTDGLVPMDGILPLSPGLDHPGLIAREPSVLLKAADALGAQRMAANPTVLAPPSHALELVDEAAAAVCGDVVEILANEAGLPAGVGVDYPTKDELIHCFALAQGPAVVAAHRDIIGTWPSESRHYPDYMIQRLTVAEERNAFELARGNELRAYLRLQLNDLLEDSVLVLPVTGCPAPSTDEPELGWVNGNGYDIRQIVLPNTVAANIAGLPSITIPYRSNGEEYGVQLLGPQGSDVTLLELASTVMLA